MPVLIGMHVPLRFAVPMEALAKIALVRGRLPLPGRSRRTSRSGWLRSAGLMPS